MTLLTADQITEIADALQALAEELDSRDWGPAAGQAVLTQAAGHVIAQAFVRTPVPQAAYFQPAPPPYPYGPDDFRPGGDQGIGLSITVTGSNRQELEEKALAAGRQVFGDGAVLTVALSGTIHPADYNRESVTQYACGAVIRQEGGQQGPVTYSGGLNDPRTGSGKE